MPGPVDPINIYSQLGGNSSVIIPFKNPTDRQVIVDVVMKERLLSRSGEFNCKRQDKLLLSSEILLVCSVSGTPFNEYFIVVLKDPDLSPLCVNCFAFLLEFLVSMKSK